VYRCEGFYTHYFLYSAGLIPGMLVQGDLEAIDISGTGFEALILLVFLAAPCNIVLGCCFLDAALNYFLLFSTTVSLGPLFPCDQAGGEMWMAGWMD